MGKALRELINKIPDAEVVTSLAPEELGAQIIFWLQQRVEDHRRQRTPCRFVQATLINEIGQYGQSCPYPRAKLDDVKLALAEAFAWLRAQGLLISDPLADVHADYITLSRRARQFASPADVAGFVMARKLPREMLHPLIAEEVWKCFVRADYEAAVFKAMKRVEIEVRRASGAAKEPTGVALMRSAFDKSKGKLADRATASGERQAVSDLFAGAFGAFRNPTNHRDVDLDDPAEVVAIVMLASQLLRMVDARRE